MHEKLEVITSPELFSVVGLIEGARPPIVDVIRTYV
jgi:hypothetical protein